MRITRRRLASWLGVAAVAAGLFVFAGGPAHAAFGWDQIRQRASERCLDVKREDDWYHANARVQLWNCSTASEKQWSRIEYGLEPPSGEFGVRKKLFQFVSLRSGMCMQARNGPISDSQIDQIPCAPVGGSIEAAENQLWEVNVVGTNGRSMHYKLTPWSAVRRQLPLCLSTYSFGTGNGTLMFLQVCQFGEYSAHDSFEGTPLRSSTA